MEAVIYLIVALLSVVFSVKLFYPKFYEDLLVYKSLVLGEFDTFDKLVMKDIVRYQLFHVKILLVNDPQMINNVLSSDVCMDKPMLFYTMIDIDMGMISAPSEF